ncbi:hypothetical protein CAPTEDRAFT_184854 [Capitella teleta]|uniref:Glycosyltransferase family 92 protein n=1 Tax=Capitella teleta TaxID=283909 RepID=X1ZH62_CAPTE|nr:hypothetical protein CAPTEDRAFT_184854 [Capitella teleta]|eukprot:ELT90068.1 hypothetical protein CAPTEDRAFT_184854 [Capitella teleta]
MRAVRESGPSFLLESSIDFAIENSYNTILDELPPYKDEPRFQKFGKKGGVYSAFFDGREPSKPVIRIISVLQGDIKVMCHMIAKSPDGSTIRQTVPAKLHPLTVSKIPSQRNLLASTIVICPVAENSPVPHHVVLAQTKDGDSIASLNVLNTNRVVMKYNFTVCLHKPLFEINLKEVPRLLEWIAVNRVFGGDHFVMYTLPSTEEIHTYLQPLVDTGLLEIHSWDLDIASGDTEENHSQKAAINECMYRYMYSSNRIVMLDFDEFPTPHSEENWHDVIANSPCANKSAAYFRNAFFPRQAFSDNSHSDLHLTSLLQTRRANETYRCPLRSKLVINPRHVLICVVHHVSKFVGNFASRRECCMPEEQGFLHHYRFWPYKEDPITKESDGVITDRRMWHFENKIVESVEVTPFLYAQHDGGFRSNEPHGN